VSELKNKVDEDSNTYSSAKNRNSTEMVELKRQIDEDQKQCLHLSVEKVSHAQGCLDMIQQRLKQLDEEIATIDEFMLSQPQQVLVFRSDWTDLGFLFAPVLMVSSSNCAILKWRPEQGGDDEDEGAGGTSRGGAGSSRKRKAQSIEDWLVVGKFVEVNWEEDWWQASIKQIKQKQGGAMSGGGMRGPPVSVLVSYVGGDEGEDEWIQVASGRLRPPSDTFHEAPAPE
jgi:hypothetical protein